MHGQADGPRLVRQRPHDRLADPPRRVRREPGAALAVELLDRAQEAEVAFLDQIRQREPAVAIAPGDLHDEPQIGLREPGLGGRVARAHAPRQRRLLLAGEQRDARDLLQVDSQVLAAGLARLFADLAVDFVDERVERLVGHDVFDFVTHAVSGPSRRSARSAAATASR